MSAPDGERGATAIATLAAGIVLAAFVAGKAARDAIAIEQFGIRALPWLVGGAAILSLPFVLAISRLFARFGPRRVVPVLQIAGAVALVAEWLGLRVAPHAAAAAVYLQLSAGGSVLVSGFWSLVTERFDARAARRQIGRIGFGATLGGVAGGAIAERTGAYASTDAVLLVLAGLQLAGATALVALRRGPTAGRQRATWPSLATVARSRLLRTLAAIVVLGSLAATVLDFELKAELAASGRGLLRLLAGYYMIVSAITAIVQLAAGRDVIARLGVPRAVAALPLGVAATSALALAVPSLLATALARGLEMVTRSSIYRSAYELLYAPLAEEHKRPTKVVIDVGADRVGDLLGAQLVALVLALAAAPRATLFAIAALAGLAGLALAARLRPRYAEALEQSLLLAGDAPAAAPDPAMVSLPGAGRADEAPRLPSEPHADSLPGRLSDLRSGDPERARRALEAPIAAELVGAVIPLLAWDTVAEAAAATLRATADRDTGALADALLDRRRAFAIRRRVAAILPAGRADLAAWSLWRGLDDPRFEVRYRCGRALAHVHADGAPLDIAEDAVFAAALRELAHGEGARLLDPDDDDGPHARVIAQRCPHVLRHVFTLLGLVLPTRTVDIALEAISTDEPALHATALEYLETVLPGELHAALAPLIDSAAVAAPRHREHARAALEQAHPSIRASLHRLARDAVAAL